MTRKDVALYYYVNMCLKNFLKKFIYKSFKSLLNNEKHWIQSFRNVFEYSIIIRII